MNEVTRAIRRTAAGEIDLDGMLRVFAEYGDWQVVAARLDGRLVPSFGCDEANRLWLTLYSGEADSPTGESLRMQPCDIAALIDDSVYGLQIDPGDDSTLIRRPSLDMFVAWTRTVLVERVLAGADHADVPALLQEHDSWHVWRRDDRTIVPVFARHGSYTPAIAAAVDAARRMTADVDAARAQLFRVDGVHLFDELAAAALDGIAIYLGSGERFKRLDMPPSFARDVVAGNEPRPSHRGPR